MQRFEICCQRLKLGAGKIRFNSHTFCQILSGRVIDSPSYSAAISLFSVPVSYRFGSHSFCRISFGWITDSRNTVVFFEAAARFLISQLILRFTFYSCLFKNGASSSTYLWDSCSSHFVLCWSLQHQLLRREKRWNVRLYCNLERPYSICGGSLWLLWNVCLQFSSQASLLLPAQG